MLSLLLWNAVSKNSKGKLHIFMLNLGGIDFTPVCALNLKFVCSLCFTCRDAGLHWKPVGGSLASVSQGLQLPPVES